MTKRKLDNSQDMAMLLNKIKLNIGIIGGGVVGGGVYELIQKCQSSNKFSCIGAEIFVSKICVRSLEKPRDFQIKSDCKLVTDYNDILNDSSINCVVELMGGTGVAKDIVFNAIKAGKHIVTANKALIAAYLPEIQAALKENPSVSFNFEAAVCGGIPIIHSLQTGTFSLLKYNVSKLTINSTMRLRFLC